MPRWLKIIIGVLASLLCLLMMAWCLAAYYIHKNNQKILSAIIGQANQQINGTLKAEKMETTLLQGFPNISVSLKNVLLRDRLWKEHKHDLLNAKNIEISLNIRALLRAVINIRKIQINDAQIYLYTDSNGYSNTNLFKSNAKKKNEGPNKASPFEVGDIRFNHLNFVLDDKKRLKNFHFNIYRLNAQIQFNTKGWHTNIYLKTQVKSFSFNTQKGSFLKDKMLEGKLVAHSDKKNKTITIEQKKLTIDNDAYFIGAKINLLKTSPTFQVDIKASNLLFQNIAKNLSPHISSKLLKFAIEQPVSVTGHIIGDGNKSAKDPLIKVQMVVKNNQVTIPSGVLTDCNFIGTFTNKENVNKPIGDENSVIKFFQLKANYYNAPITVDTFKVIDLNRPIVEGLVKAAFHLNKLNNNINSDIYQFSRGQANLQIYCKADIDNFRFTKPTLFGKVAIKDADILYKPRNIHLVKSSLLLTFNEKDLNITGTHLQVGKSMLNVNCYIQNFLNLYYSKPDKVVANLSIKSPQLYINELVPFLSPRKKIKQKIKRLNSLQEISNQLNEVLKVAHIQIKLAVNKAVFHKFIATNLNASLTLRGKNIYFNTFDVNHAGGHISFNGNLKQLDNLNQFFITSTISNVSVKDFFYAFNDFDQKGVTHKNLNGYLFAKVTAKGNISHNGHLIKKSMYGIINFDLKKGVLQNFEPFKKIQKIAFVNRDLSKIMVDDLTGKLTLDGDKVFINPMEVSTSVLNFNIKGMYGLNKGTDIDLDIPLRNPKKDKNTIDRKALRKARMRGIVLHLKALDDGNGGLKIRFRGKNKE